MAPDKRRASVTARSPGGFSSALKNEADEFSRASETRRERNLKLLQRERKRNALLLSGAFLSVCFIVIGVFLLLSDWLGLTRIRESRYAAETAVETDRDGAQGTMHDSSGPSGSNPGSLDSLRSAYPDCIAWLNVHSLYQINFPVFQRDNAFYLDHDASGRKNSKGAAFLDENCSLSPRDQNLIVYAHNLASGEMFGSLFRMAETAYLSNDPFVSFITEADGAEYVPVAVLRTTVGYRDGEFDFLQRNFDTADAFNRFIGQARAHSQIALSIECEEQDDYLTLVTCSDREGTGRLVAILRKVRSEEEKALLLRYFQALNEEG